MTATGRAVERAAADLRATGAQVGDGGLVPSGRQGGGYTVLVTVDDEPATTGRRERKKNATRAAIRDAALRLALRDGVENVTLEQIATEADIALRTFFNYFSSKEEAVVAGAAEDFRAFVAAVRVRPRSETVLQALREAVLVVMNQMVSDERDHIAALVAIRGAPSLVPQLLAALAAQEEALAEAIAERVDAHTAGSVYPRLCAATVLACLRVTLDRWLDGSAPGAVPSFASLGAEVDRGIAELAAGLDRPGSPG